MIAASNTGPLIALARLNRMDVLTALFEQTWIPAIVHRELLAKTAPESDQLLRTLGRLIQVAEEVPLTPQIRPLIDSADLGEQHAIDLAYRLKATLLMDDRAGRAAAARCGILATGTAGLLIKAKRAGLVPAVMPLLKTIRDSGYWLSDALLIEARRMAGED